jgi:hypothetical protein
MVKWAEIATTLHLAERATVVASRTSASRHVGLLLEEASKGSKTLRKDVFRCLKYIKSCVSFASEVAMPIKHNDQREQAGQAAWLEM